MNLTQATAAKCTFIEQIFFVVQAEGSNVSFPPKQKDSRSCPDLHISELFLFVLDNLEEIVN